MPHRVFPLMYYDYEDTWLVGVFYTREQAEAVKARFPNLTRLVIEPRDMDEITGHAYMKEAVHAPA